MKYDITVKTLAIIGIFSVIGGLFSACGNQIGDGGDADSNNDNSNNIIDFGEGSEEEKCNVEYLYKPESESDGNLVILFERGVIFAEVCVEVAADDSLDCQDNYTITNGGRATYRFPKKGEEYSGLILTESCEFKVNEPAERQE